MKHRWLLVVLVAVLSFGSGAWLVRPGVPLSQEAFRRARMFEAVLDRIGTDYVDTVDAADLYTEAARGAVASLHDPYAELLVGSDFDAFNRQLAGRALGLAPLDPSALPPDSTDAVHAYLFPDGIGYLEMRAVTERAAIQVRSAVDSLYARGARRLVLDLRYNPGGLIDQGVAVADFFLQPGDTVATLVGRNPSHTRTYVADRDPRWPGLSLALLVGPNTASAAELLTAALQDHERAVVVGGRTYGKGVVQTTFRLDDDVAVKLTTSRWFRPSGRSIQRPPADSLDQSKTPTWGIAPDVDVRGYRAGLGERRLLHAVGGDLDRLRTVMDGYARELARSGRVGRGRLAVTSAMRDGLLQRLRGAGLRITPEVYADAEPYVTRTFGYAVARAVAGPEAEFRRRSTDDRQLQAALRLLRDSTAAR